MAKRQRLMKLATAKSVLLLFLCSFLLLKATQLFRALNAEISRNSVMPQFQISIGVSLKSEEPKCSQAVHLGLPRYVAEICQSESDLSCSNLTCANLLFGANASIYKEAREFMKRHTIPILKDSELFKITRNCTDFKLRRGFEQKIKNTEGNFSVAFNLIVHRDVEQIERLIYALFRPQNRFCVHLDLKASPETREALEGISRCLPNVFMASKRIAVYWGEFNRLEADIVCMKDHIESSSNWKYLINTAGQAFPIRSMREMEEILKIYNGVNDIEGMTGNRVIRNRFEYEFDRGNGALIVMKEPKVRHPDPPHDFDIVRGSAYGIFSREFVKYILNEETSKDLLKWSNGTFSPDEFYWATLHHTYTNPHLHPPGGYAGDPNVKPWLAVYANWLEEPCHGYQEHGICVFGVEDLPHLVHRREFFVNKFHADFEPMALDCLRAWVDYKDSCTELRLLDTEFYKALPFIKKN